MPVRRKASKAGATSTARARENNGDLRSLVQQRLVEDVLQKTHAKHDGWMVMVVDPPAMRVISSVMGMYDLMESKVTLVEDLVKKRASFPEMGAIYLLSATSRSVDRLCRDYMPEGDRETPLYGNAAFIYFLGKLPDKLLSQMKTCKPLIKRIKGLGEINVDFLAKEARAFHFDMGPAFADLMLNPEGPTKAHAMVAAKLVTVCATLNEYPHIRYRASSKVGESIAQIFHKKMNDFVGSSADWWYYGDPKHTSRERGQILLLGRTDDCLSPLMHEFTYQAMVNDLLPIKDDQITYQADKEGGGKQDKDVLLNEKDEIWVELRGQHIAAVIQILSARIRDVVNSKTGSALNQTDSSGKPISMSQMASALKALPEYKELMSKLSMHMTIAHRCMEVLNKKGLMDLADLEQTLATGTDDNGSSPKLPALIQQVDEELSNMSDPKAKLRLLLILIVSQKGLQENVRDRLFEVAQLSSADKKTLMNLEKMGISTVAEEKKTSFFGGQKLASSGRGQAESEYAASRYITDTKVVLENMANNLLDIEEFPSVMPMPMPKSTSSKHGGKQSRRNLAQSARKSSGSSWGKKEEKKVINYTGHRNIVFMIGGMCFSELRAFHDVHESTGVEIYAGSTSFDNPSRFVKNLSSLSKGGGKGGGGKSKSPRKKRPE